VLSACATTSRSPAGDPLSGARLFADVERYTALGEHRSGGPANRAAARWLAGRLQRAGYATTTPEWPLTLFDLQTRRLEVGGRPVECFPLWFPRTTAPGGVSGPLRRFDPASSASLAGAVALIEFPNAAIGADGRNAALVRSAAERGAVAAVGWQSRRGDRFLTWNVEAPFNQQPWPIPVVTIARRDHAQAAAAAEQGAPARVVIEGRSRATTAPNVLARRPRPGRSIIVSTPLSGWIRNGGERGPGIALFLALAEAVAARAPDVGYIFTAHSGHEIGHMGQDHFFRTVAPKPADVIAWVHLGSGIATRREADGGAPDPAAARGLRHVVATPGLHPLAAPVFGRTLGVDVRTSDPGGELADIIQGGFPAIGLYGGNAFTHTAEDDAAQTSPALLQPVALALDAVLAALEQRA
jgi:hypothetical protein